MPLNREKWDDRPKPMLYRPTTLIRTKLIQLMTELDRGSLTSTIDRLIFERSEQEAKLG